MIRAPFLNPKTEADYEIDFDEIMRDGEGHQESLEMMSLLMQDMMNRKEGKVAPDTYGADKFFLDGFLNDDMNFDFMAIAHDFLKHNFDRLKEFNELALYDNTQSSLFDPEEALHIKILNIMYNAAKAGDPYSAALIKHLYKVYHKKEYKQLKRFSKISVSELFSLSENEQKNCSFDAMGRILGMCSIMGIEMEEKCSVLYLFLEKRRKEIDEEEKVDFLNFREGLFQECMEQIESWQEEERGKQHSRKYVNDSKTFWKLDQFVALALEHEGVQDDYIYRCNMNFMGTKTLFARTLALLKSAYPKQSFTYEDVQIYAHIVNAVEALTSVSDMMDNKVSELLGILNDRYEFDEEACLFKPEHVIYKDTRQQAKPPIQNTINVAQVSNGKADKEDYLREISELRKRLREKELESRYFNEQYNQEKRRLNELQEVLKNHERDHEELIALRNYMYEISEEAPELPKQSIEEMKAAIAGRRVVIIGGNDNWIKKVKLEFPEWKFLGANVSGAVNSMSVRSAEMVYFFTDTLGHSNYSKFMAVIREHKVRFGYIHGVSINANIAQIYKDLTD